jgi:hypothetical protein
MYNLSNLSKLSGGEPISVQSQPTQPTELQTITNLAGTGLKWYGQLHGIFSGITALLSLFIFIYGIYLLANNNDSQWNQIEVTITKIQSKDNNTCDATTLINSNSSRRNSSTTQNIVYNCFVTYQFNDKEIMSQVINDSKNYTVGQKIKVWYNKNNPNDNPVIESPLTTGLAWCFIIVGGIMSIILILLTYCIFTNESFAKGVGCFSCFSNLTDY